MRKQGTEEPLETLLYSIMLHDATRLADCLVISNSTAATTKAQGLEHWQHSTPYMASLNVLSSSFEWFSPHGPGFSLLYKTLACLYYDPV